MTTLAHAHAEPKPLTPAEHNKALETLVAGRLIALRKARYFSALLLSFVPRAAPGLGTVGVTKRGIVLWDPAFLLQLTVEQAGGLWLHECLHRLNKHGERRGERDPVLWNYAGDLAINPAVLEMGAELPGGNNAGLFPRAFGFPEGLTADEYYALLIKKAEKAQENASGQGQKGKGDGSKGKDDGTGDGDGGGEDADHANPGGVDKPKVAGGFCGSCAGRPVPGEPDDGDPEGRTDAELDRTVRETAEAIKAEASKGRGRIPSALARWADVATQVPKIPWRQKLARVARNAVAWRQGAVDYRYDAPSRRQAGLGYGVGRPILPRLRTPVPRIAIVLDTSGSMGTKELQDALTEVKGVLTAVGAEIEFCACDAAVHSLAPIHSIGDAMKLVRGGGGTDFRPAFEALEARKPRPEVVIFATDGMGPAPECAPHGMRVVWLLVGPYRQAPCAWGEVVEVED